MNVWLPLDPVRTQLPSLEIVKGSHAAMRRLRLLDAKSAYRDGAFASTLGPAAVPVLSQKMP
jgi:hypothetical protein